MRAKAKKKKFYEVTVCRTSTSTETIRVKARNKKEAKKEALDAALDIVFDDDDAEYGATSMGFSGEGTAGFSQQGNRPHPPLQKYSRIQKA